MAPGRVDAVVRDVRLADPVVGIGGRDRPVRVERLGQGAGQEADRGGEDIGLLPSADSVRNPDLGIDGLRAEPFGKRERHRSVRREDDPLGAREIGIFGDHQMAGKIRRRAVDADDAVGRLGRLALQPQRQEIDESVVGPDVHRLQVGLADAVAGSVVDPEIGRLGMLGSGIVDHRDREDGLCGAGGNDHLARNTQHGVVVGRANGGGAADRIVDRDRIVQGPLQPHADVHRLPLARGGKFLFEPDTRRQGNDRNGVERAIIAGTGVPDIGVPL